MAPTFTLLAASSDDICVIVLNNFVPSIVLLLTPVIVSVWAFPLASVPIIVKFTEALLEVLVILTVEFKLEEAVLERIPSIAKFPAALSVSLSTRPSASLATDSATFTSSKLLVSDKLTVMFDKSVVLESVIWSFVFSTMLTSFDEELASSLTAAKLREIGIGEDVAVLPLVSCTTASTSKFTGPL